MNHEVIVTCAVTGAGDTVGRHPTIPVTPKQIAAAAIEAAKAGATVAHCHVRDPQTGKPSRDVALYRELVERITLALVEVLDKKPEHTHIVIDEVDPQNWGFAGMLTDEFRKRAAGPG